MPKLPLAERQERQPAEALLLGAKQFMRASQILLRHEPRSEKGDYFESGYIMYPYFFLVGQSVELSLRSVLLRAGKDHDFIQYTVGHDLEKSSDIVRKIEPNSDYFLICTRMRLRPSTSYIMERNFNTDSQGMLWFQPWGAPTSGAATPMGWPATFWQASPSALVGRGI